MHTFFFICIYISSSILKLSIIYNRADAKVVEKMLKSFKMEEEM